MEKVKRANRRTKVELDKKVIDTAENLIKEVGFNNISLNKLLESGGILPSIFYNRYYDLNELFEKIARKYDYFFNDLIKYEHVNHSPAQNYENFLFSLVDLLKQNKIMQKLLIWEISCNNYITKRSSNSRELHNRELLGYLECELKNSDLDINALTAIISGGICFLSLYCDRSPFFGIDLKHEDGIMRIKKIIHIIIEGICNKNIGNKINEFSNQQDSYKDINEHQNIEFAKSLLDNKVDIKIIKKVTGLSNKILQSIEIQKLPYRPLSSADKTSPTNTPKKRGRPRIKDKENHPEIPNMMRTPRKRGRPKKNISF